MAEECYSLLKLALSFDEHNKKSEAVRAYLDAVEAILKLSDSEQKDKLKRYANEALNRAEKLKIELNPSYQVASTKRGTHNEPSQVGESFNFIFVFCKQNISMTSLIQSGSCSVKWFIVQAILNTI